jgi:hypothetical protein
MMGDMAIERRNWKSDVDAIRRILMAEWDPIGCGVPDDEYDSYIPRIYTLLQQGISIRDLAIHLRKLEAGAMGLEGRPEINPRVAKLLVELIESGTGHKGPA